MNLVKLLILIIFSTVALVSCNKNKKYNENYSFLEGNYSGTAYYWSRDYDSTHVNVVITRDTVYNITGHLEINQETNIIRFDSVLYTIHDDLNSIANQDTILAKNSYSTRPSHQLKIIKSIKNVQFSSSYYAPVGPNAGGELKDYFKN